MDISRPQPAIDGLRAQIEKIEGHRRRAQSVLPVGLARVDSRLPGKGWREGRYMRLPAAVTASSMALRQPCSPPVSLPAPGAACSGAITQADIFAPTIAQAGLPPDRVIYLEADDQASVLACMEKGHRRGALGAVVGEVAQLCMKAYEGLAPADARRRRDRHHRLRSAPEVEVLHPSKHANTFKATVRNRHEHRDLASSTTRFPPLNTSRLDLGFPEIATGDPRMAVGYPDWAPGDALNMRPALSVPPPSRSQSRSSKSLRS
jgi:hypothetical protein